MIVVGKEGIDHVRVAFRLDQREQRMLGTEGVPQRKHRVMGSPLGLMNILVETSILTVDVLVEIGSQARVVE